MSSQLVEAFNKKLVANRMDKKTFMFAGKSFLTEATNNTFTIKGAQSGVDLEKIRAVLGSENSTLEKGLLTYSFNKPTAAVDKPVEGNPDVKVEGGDETQRKSETDDKKLDGNPDVPAKTIAPEFEQQNESVKGNNYGRVGKTALNEKGEEIEHSTVLRASKEGESHVAMHHSDGGVTLQKHNASGVVSTHHVDKEEVPFLKAHMDNHHKLNESADLVKLTESLRDSKTEFMKQVVQPLETSLKHHSSGSVTAKIPSPAGIFRSLFMDLELSVDGESSIPSGDPRIEKLKLNISKDFKDTDTFGGGKVRLTYMDHDFKTNHADVAYVIWNNRTKEIVSVKDWSVDAYQNI